MSSARVLAALVLLALSLGCRHASTPLEARPDPIVPTKPAKPALCDGGPVEAKRAYQAAWKTWQGNAAPTTKVLIGWCKESPAGAWWFDMPDVKPAKDPHEFEYITESQLVVVFQPHEGAAARRVLKDYFSDYGIRVANEPWTYDYDHDGVPELYVQAHEEGEEGHHALLLELLSYRGGAVERYPATSKLVAAGTSDVDGDGRPDLLLLAGYGDTLESCGSGFPFDFPEPRFVAHARPDGTFSTDDAEAKAYVRKWCPASPAKLESSADAVCARLWAKDVAKERARVVASCTEWSCALENAGKPQKPLAAEDCIRRRAFYDKAPPLTLP